MRSPLSSRPAEQLAAFDLDLSSRERYDEGLDEAERLLGAVGS